MDRHIKIKSDVSAVEQLYDAGYEPLPIIPYDAIINSSSKISPDNRGKVPGKLLSDGTWVGLLGWTSLKIVPRKIRTWGKWPDAGACVRTGSVVGADIDVTDEKLSLAIEQKGGVARLVENWRIGVSS